MPIANHWWIAAYVDWWIAAYKPKIPLMTISILNVHISRLANTSVKLNSICLIHHTNSVSRC